MSVKKEDLENGKVRLTITVEPEVFRENIEKAYRKDRSSFSMPGFRKGNVPRAIIEANYGPDVFYRSALELLLPESLNNALNEAEISPVADPDITAIESMDRETGVTYVAEVYVFPEIELGDYHGIEAEERNYDIRDEDVDKEVERIRRESGRWVQVDRPAQDGDTVTIDYTGTINGVAFDGGTGEGLRVLIGSGAMIAGFEDALVGISVGEDKTFDVTFPPDYGDQELAGKPATFNVHATDVQEIELPEIDDDFAQDVSGLETMTEYRDELRSELQTVQDRKRDSDVEAQIISEIVKRSSANVPQPMIDQEVDKDIMRLQLDLAQRGVDISAVLQANNLTAQQLRDSLSGPARDRIMAQLAVGKLAQEFNAAATEDEVDAELQQIAQRTRKSYDDLTSNMTPEQRRSIADRLTWQKTLDELKRISNITRVELESLDQFRPTENDEQDDNSELHNETEVLVEEQN